MQNSWSRKKAIKPQKENTSWLLLVWLRQVLMGVLQKERTAPKHGTETSCFCWWQRPWCLFTKIWAVCSSSKVTETHLGISALLLGQVLEVYYWLSEKAATDYDRFKLVLIKRYVLTEDGYRQRFRASKSEVDENPEQFIVQLDTYLLWCLELLITEWSFAIIVSLKDLQ